MAPITLFLGAISYLAARLFRRFLPGLNRWLRIILAATVPLLALFIAGFAFSVNSSFADWIAQRPPWAWTNIGLLLFCSFIGAWLPTRQQKQQVDISTFE